MAPQKTNQVIRAVPWNISKKRVSPEDFHETNLAEGFMYIDVDIDDAHESNIVTIQNKLKAIDEKANAIDEKTGKRISNQKPYFRYTSIQPDGGVTTHGGGWYLYTGWAETDDKRFHKNCKANLKGLEPVYFRAKSAIQNTNVPNFSIQWRRVKTFYYKFSPDSKAPLHVQSGNKIIKITGL